MKTDAIDDDLEPVSAEGLAGAALGLLRSLSALAEQSLDATAPEVSLQQFRAMTVLNEKGPQSAAALAAALGIAPSTMTRLANRLVRDGLVDRTSDAADRRSVVLTATRRGARIGERVKAWRLRELERCLADAPAGDRRALLAALEQCGELLATGVPDAT